MFDKIQLAKKALDVVVAELDKEEDREPFNGDETEAITDCFLRLLDYNEGNITTNKLTDEELDAMNRSRQEA